MFGEKCNLQGLNGIQQLERVGPYVVIANRKLHERGESRRFTLINETELSLHSIHGSQRAAIVFARKHGEPYSAISSQEQIDDNSTSERF